MVAQICYNAENRVFEAVAGDGHRWESERLVLALPRYAQMNDTARILRQADMTGKVAVLIGIGSDIGVALALHAAERGMKVALADTDRRLLAAAGEKVRARNVETLTVDIEQFDLASLREVAQRTETVLGAPWLTCNAAGPTVDDNLWGVINGVQAFAPDMALRRSGHIVNIAAGCLFYLRGAAVDVATSHAIVGLSESLYRELDLVQSPVGVTVVCPTLINTNIAATTAVDNAIPSLARNSDLRILPPEELAEQIFVAVERHDFWICWQVPTINGITRFIPSGSACARQTSCCQKA